MKQVSEPDARCGAGGGPWPPAVLLWGEGVEKSLCLGPGLGSGLPGATLAVAGYLLRGRGPFPGCPPGNLGNLPPDFLYLPFYANLALSVKRLYRSNIYYFI